MIAGESIGAIADEVFGELQRKSWTDSQAALSILTCDGGSWRTRHLRLRAAAARQSINEGNWSIQHQPGNKMSADIGTKPLSTERIKALKEKMNMSEVPGAEDPGEKKEKDENTPHENQGLGSNLQKAAAALKLITLAAVLSVAKGEEEDEDPPERLVEFKIMMAVFTALVILATVAFQPFWKAWARTLRGGMRSQAGSSRKGSATKGKGKGGESRGTAPEGQSTECLPPVGTVREVARPSQLPPPGVEEPGEASPEPPLPPEGSSSESSDETLYRPVDERHIPPFDIEAELQRIAEEEAILYDEARRDPDRFFNYERSDEDSRPLFKVLTTRFGSVYHFRADCHYLSSPQTGPTRESGWCWMCRAISLQTRGRPPPGSPLWIDHWGGAYHVDDRCPRRHNQRVTRACQVCQDLNAGQTN